jgi:hypothetical protein
MTDPRLLRLQQGWTCKSCGQRHTGLFDLASGKPDPWPHGPEVPRNVLDVERKCYLSDDLCIVDGEHHFIRCMLYLPISDLPGQRFGYGVWSSLSKQNFAIYKDTFGDDSAAVLGPWFGWFSNSLKGFPETFSLKCDVQPQPNRQRPIIFLQPTDHPLAIAQRDGIALDRVFELYELNGHGTPTGMLSRVMQSFRRRLS